MKLIMNARIQSLTIAFLLFFAFSATAQQNEFIPRLSMVEDALNWRVVNRSVSYLEYIHLDVKPGDGLLYLNDFEFKNGKIDLDIKGKNDPGRSFVGLAFHILNDSTFDAVYFRPFNFRSPERKTHSVQYISMPQYDWYKLRQEHPGVYENMIQHVPDPDDWFHATIIINYPEVKVFVDNSVEPSLVISQISSRKKGWVGFWVGNGSEGSFRNLKITTN